MGRMLDVAGEINVLRAVKDAISAAEHLEDTDVGSVANALAFADRIQQSLDSDDPDRRHKVMYGPISSLQKILTDLGLTPQGRVNLGHDDAPEDDDDF